MGLWRRTRRDDDSTARRLVWALVLVACAGDVHASPSPEFDPSTPPQVAQTPTSPRDVRAAAVMGAYIVGAIYGQGVNDAFAAANGPMGRCARDAIAHGMHLATLQVHVHISMTGAVTAADLPNGPGDARLASCVATAMQAQPFPRPLGPPMMGVSIPPGHEAEYLVADATATYTITVVP